MAGNRLTSLQLVYRFHVAYDRPINHLPVIPSKELCDLRLKLIEEELLVELREAIEARDIVAVLDALVDAQYILDGTFLTFGLGGIKDEAFAEVHRSNMTKLDQDGNPIVREDGKILKGPNYEPPNLKQFFEFDKQNYFLQPRIDQPTTEESKDES